MEMALLVGVGAVSGFVNTLAGGGSFITVPMLVLLGLPPTVANATNRVGVFIQSAVAFGGFRQGGVPGLGFALRVLPSTLVGSWLGALLASSASDAAFGRAFGAIMLVALPLILLAPKPQPGQERRLPEPLQHALYFGIGLYGGAIQAGIGIPLLLAFAGAGGLDLVRANSAKVLIVAAITAIALGQFAVSGKVAWVYGGVLAIGSGLGGYAAARFGTRVGDRGIRPILVVAVVGLALYLLLA